MRDRSPVRTLARNTLWSSSFPQVIRPYQLARYLRDLDASFLGGPRNTEPAELVV